MTDSNDDWSYSAKVSAHIQFAVPQDALDKVLEYFRYKASVDACDNRLNEVFNVLRLGELAKRDRARYSMALAEIAKYMREVGFRPGNVSEFVELALALGELDDGVVRHFLKPNKKTGRPPDAGDIWVARAYVAMTVDVLITAGSTRAEACRRIAENFNFLAAALSPSSKGEFAAAISNWYVGFRDDEVTDDRAQSMFNSRQELLDLGMTGDSLMSSAVQLAAHSLSSDTLKTERQKLKRIKTPHIKNSTHNK